MDALVHVLATSAVSDSPLVIVASAIATGYRSGELKCCARACLWSTRQWRWGVESHVITNAGWLC